MSYEFKVTIDDSGNIKLVNCADGKQTWSVAGISLAEYLLEEFEFKLTYIYMAYKDGLFKIGITEDLSRREKELKAEIVHWIQCGSHRARIFESALHSLFREFAVGHEWFRFPTWAQYELLRPIETQRKLREFLYEQHRTFYAMHPGDWESAVAIEKLESLGVYNLSWETPMPQREGRL